MEALGRSVAVLLGAVCLVLLLFFSKTASVQWQQNETIYSISKAYAEQVMQSGAVSMKDRQAFQADLKRLGDYEAELTIFERKRFEGKNGRIYLFEERTEPGVAEISSGSYVRLVVKEKPKGWLEKFFYGDSCFVVTGGRIR